MAGDMLYPIRQGGSGDFHAFPSVDLGLAVERQMVVKLGNKDMGQQRGRRQALDESSMKRTKRAPILTLEVLETWFETAEPPTHCGGGSTLPPAFVRV